MKPAVVVYVIAAIAGAAILGSACGVDLTDDDRPGLSAERTELAAVPAALASGAIVNGLTWADTAGNPIHAHGGGIMKSGAFYYWFGENRNPDFTFKSVNVYRSADLRSWELRGNALSSGSAAELAHANIERPKVVFNAATNQFVMWMHWENGNDYSEARAAVASSPTIEGPYTYRGSFRPFAGTGIVDHGKPGYMSRDCNLFVDTDSTAYFISTANENLDLNLYRLSADYLTIASLVTTLFPGGQREAPVLFKRNSVYILLTSAATGWSPNQARYATSASLASGWSSLTNIADATTFASQPATIVAVQGTSGTSYLYAGDRWAGAWQGPYLDSMYVWLPLNFASSTAMTLSSFNTVTVNAAAGTITGANNAFSFTSRSSGKVMEVVGASTADHAAVEQFTGNAGANQRWNLNYDGAGYFSLANVNSGKVIDVPSASTADGAALIQFTSSGGDNQKWRLIDLGGGSVRIVNKHSGKAAEVFQSSTADKAIIDQWTVTGGANQIWQLTAP
jgi:hypothetical protein